MLCLFFCISFSLDNESRFVNFSFVLQSFLTQLCFLIPCLHRVFWCLTQSPTGILLFQKPLNPKAPQKASASCFPSHNNVLAIVRVPPEDLKPQRGAGPADGEEQLWGGADVFRLYAA